MDLGALTEIARRVRRSTSNRDVLALCDGVTELAHAKPAAERPKFDRTAYQRDYMRRRRAAEKTAQS